MMPRTAFVMHTPRHRLLRHAACRRSATIALHRDPSGAADAGQECNFAQTAAAGGDAASTVRPCRSRSWACRIPDKPNHPECRSTLCRARGLHPGRLLPRHRCSRRCGTARICKARRSSGFSVLHGKTFPGPVGWVQVRREVIPFAGHAAMRNPFRPDWGLRATANLLRRINLICPVQSHLQKYFCFSEPQIRTI
jgi:hypothetical protein